MAPPVPAPSSPQDDVAKLDAVLGGGSSNATPGAPPSGGASGDDVSKLNAVLGHDSNEGASGQPDPNAPQPSLTDTLLATGKNIVGMVGQGVQAAAGAAGDVATGVVKGAGDTVSTVENAASHILPENTGGRFMRNQSQLEDQFADTHGNTAQQVGKGAENIGEFFLGDEALKGLSFAEKAGVLKQMADLAEKHPAIAALIKRGLRTGAVTGAVTLAKGGTPTQAAVGAGTGAVAGGAADLAMTGAGKVVDAAKDAFTTRQIQPLVRASVDKFLAGIEKAANFVEPEAEETGELGGAPAEVKPPATSYRAKANELGQKFIDRATDTMKQLDTATGKHWQSYAQNLQDAERALNEHLSDASSETNVAQEHKLVRDVEIAKENMATANAKARAAGISQQAVDQANADFRQGNALKDFQKGLTRASSGINPDSTVDAATRAQSPEMINPKSLNDHVDRMAHQTSKYGSESRLLQAAGGDENLADKFTADTVLNNLKHAKILAKQQYLKYAVPAAAALGGLGYGGAAAGRVITHMFDGKNVVPVQ